MISGSKAILNLVPITIEVVLPSVEKMENLKSPIPEGLESSHLSRKLIQHYFNGIMQDQ